MKKKSIRLLLPLPFLAVLLFIGVFAVGQKTNFFGRAASLPINTSTISTRGREGDLIPDRVLGKRDFGTRGREGDLWADIVIGKRDFGEISPREVVSYKLHSPGGVIVDQSIKPKMYVWDSGNNRILGLDLAKCLGGTSPCKADLIIGQPSDNDHGACNQDSSFSDYPKRKPASASTLCGVSESTHTTLEDKTFVSFYTDPSGNLYVPDFYNHRILKFNSPFTTDVVADEVWGQPDFNNNGCNLTGGVAGGLPNQPPFPPPNPSSLCFQSVAGSGAGVTLDATGNMWVADGGNNRVLRFPKISTGNMRKTADLVLGQQTFSQNGSGQDLNQMYAPSAVRFEQQGKLYVADQYNNRVLVFSPPFTTGMSGQVFGSTSSGPTDIEILPTGNILTYEHLGAKVKIWDQNGNLLQQPQTNQENGGGSVGVDTDGNLFFSTYTDPDVFRIPKSGGVYTGYDRRFFAPPGGYNLTTGRRFETPGWVGVAVAGNQLFAADQRLLFWNNAPKLNNGQDPDGYLGTSSVTDIPPNYGYSAMAVDDSKRLFVTKITNGQLQSQVEVYQTPVKTGDKPIKTISSADLLGGGSVNFNQIRGLAVSPDAKFLWLGEVDNHRVLRIRDPLTKPVVDVVLGQTDISGNQCNRGLIPPPNQGTGQVADKTMLCYPGAVSLDKKGNLYVSDHFLESAGNWRLLMFSPTTFPENSTAITFAPAATKEFPAKNSPSFLTFQPAFDSTNRMVVGFNPYSGNRFVSYFDDPTTPNSFTPTGYLKDFYNWPVATTFDKNDNLYVYDANRGQVRIYLKPFVSATLITHKGCNLNACTIMKGPGPDTCDSNRDCCLPGDTCAPLKPSLLLNSSFEIDKNNDNIPDDWQPIGLKPGDGIDKQIHYDGANSFKFTSASGYARGIIQFVTKSGNKGETVNLSLWDKQAQNSPTPTRTKIATFTIYYTDGKVDVQSKALKNNLHDWTQTNLSLKTQKPYRMISAAFYDNGSNAIFYIDKTAFTATSP